MTDKHGIFISYRRKNWKNADRIHDILSGYGYYPFMDINDIKQENFSKKIRQAILEAPYFLCILSKQENFGKYYKPFHPSDWMYQELLIALEYEKRILFFAEQGFKWPKKLPDEIMKFEQKNGFELKKMNIYFFDPQNRDSFSQRFHTLCKRDIDPLVLFENGVNWKSMTQGFSNIYLDSRKNIESTVASLENRFGQDFIRFVKETDETNLDVRYEGLQYIRSVRMSCYAGNIIFANNRRTIDPHAYDFGIMFRVFTRLLQDETFLLDIVINAPGSIGAMDAISKRKLGNSTLRKHEQAVFLSSFFGISDLKKSNKVFEKAWNDRRFRFGVTDEALPYSIFIVEYKKPYEKYDHIKIDLYSNGLDTNMERRSMIIFKEFDKDNYDFFERQYSNTKQFCLTEQDIANNISAWKNDWNTIREEIYN